MYSEDMENVMHKTYNTYWEDSEHQLRNARLKFRKEFYGEELGDWEYRTYDEYG